MRDRYYSYLKQWVPEPEKVKFLLAVSGGKDSCALLDLFSAYNLQYDIAHCNFHLREEESNEDMQFVKELGATYQANVLLKEFFAEDFLAMKGKSTEMIAREMRYHWFEELSPMYDYIVTAHHADDNAETLLLNLVRGTGLKGMTGIPPRNGKIIRPLLAFSSEEILHYLETYQLPYKIDRTNLSEQYHRNKIRLSVLPKLKEINPNVIHTFRRNIDIFNRQYQFYAKQIDLIKKRLLHQTEHQTYIIIAELQQEQDMTLVLYEMLSDYLFNAETVDDILDSLSKTSGKRFYSSSHLLLKDREKLIIAPIKKVEKESVQISDITSLEQYGFEVKHLPFADNIDYIRDNSVLYVDAEKLTFPLTLRHWQEGDAFYPLGMKGRKKLSDFFNDEKIDLLSKHAIPLLCCDNDIVWVVGHRSDNRYKIETNKTKYYYKIKYYGIL